ncbi:MAG: carbon starvation CstA family protein [Parolsenella sp.]|uniref:carbon starvation CstA family protein n=1 Tax=Parolsenella sp. TaxID=2083006 RepID=UPI002E79DDE7|nr:carbon starvation CstA family protein [Parolsenella sp.]MEE1372948.1 carbon starvation CstA family protein [Parolsenella sp.]
MNGIAVMVVCAAVLFAGYMLYGRWLANKWGVDVNAVTPARRMEDGNAFSPASAFTVFSHQFSSICGAGPVTGTIVAMAFGWLPVVLWVLVGGIFFGAVHDFGALYASMKNNGKSLAQLVDKYIGKTGRRLFLLFCWLFCIIVIAAFTSMVCGTFAQSAKASDAVNYAAASTGTISILFTFVAIAFGWARNKFNLTGAAEFVVAVVMVVAMFAVGMVAPLRLGTNAWIAIVMVYLVFAGAMPIQTLKQPRDYLTTIMMLTMIVCAVFGIVVLGVNGQATMTAPMFTGFSTKSGMMFPVLFVSVACGALSGFHSLVSSGTSSKQVSNEADAVKVGYGAMVLESFVGILAIVIAGIMWSTVNTLGADGAEVGTAFQVFARGVAKGMTAFGVDSTVATVFMQMNVSALCLTSLDAVARIARTSFSEFFASSNDALAIDSKSGAMKVLGNPWFATVVTLVPGLALTFGGYLNIWPLFGASNQLLGGMTMITLAVFCKCTGRKGWMLYVPVAFLLVCTFTSLVQSALGCYAAVSAYGFFGTIPATETTAAVSVAATKGLQLVFAVLLMVLGLIVAVNCLKELFGKEAGSMPDEQPEWTELGREHVAGSAGKGAASGAAATQKA